MLLSRAQYTFFGYQSSKRFLCAQQHLASQASTQPDRIFHLFQCICISTLWVPAQSTYSTSSFSTHTGKLNTLKPRKRWYTCARNTPESLLILPARSAFSASAHTIAVAYIQRMETYTEAAKFVKKEVKSSRLQRRAWYKIDRLVDKCIRNAETTLWDILGAYPRHHRQPHTYEEDAQAVLWAVRAKRAYYASAMRAVFMRTMRSIWTNVTCHCNICHYASQVQ